MGSLFGGDPLVLNQGDFNTNASTPGLIATNPGAPSGTINTSNPGLPAGFTTSNTQQPVATTTSQVSGGGYYDPAAAARAADINLANQIYQTQKTGLQSQLDTLGSQQQAAQLGVTNQYQTKFNDLKAGFAKGNRNLDIANNQVQDQRVRSLADIRDSLQRQSMSYNNQLGALGAGDSSAAGQINMALSGLASKNRGNVMGEASRQETAIGLQRKDLEDNYNTQTRDLNSWKQGSIADIAQTYMTKRQQIQSAMANADAEHARALAEQDASYRQQAIQALQNVENQYRAQAGEINNFFNSYFAPKDIAINSQLQQYAVDPISAGTLRNVGQVQQQAIDPQVAAMRKYEEDQQKAILGY